jgi:hypothetical protein
VSHRQGNTKEFDKRWRKVREKAKAAKAARKKQRGFFNITTAQWNLFLLTVAVFGYLGIRGIEWLVSHISFHWHVS